MTHRTQCSPPVGFDVGLALPRVHDVKTARSGSRLRTLFLRHVHGTGLNPLQIILQGRSKTCKKKPNPICREFLVQIPRGKSL
jgi:hypothetical protein